MTVKMLEVLVRADIVVRRAVDSAFRRLDTADDRGASALEYAVLVGLILALVVVGVRFLGNRASTLLDSATSALS